MPNTPTKPQSSMSFKIKNVSKLLNTSEERTTSFISDNEDDSDDFKSDLEPKSTKKPLKIKTSGLFGHGQIKSPGSETTRVNHIETLVKHKSTNNLELKSSDSSMSTNMEKVDSSDSQICDALKLRQKNIQERDKYLASFLNDPEFAEAVQHIGLFKKKSNEPKLTEPKIKKKKSKCTDETFRFTGHIPSEKRRSLRLQYKEPTCNSDHLMNETDFSSYGSKKRQRGNSSDDDCDYTDIEKVIYQPKKRSLNKSRTSKRTKFLQVEDVTENMIKNIAWRVLDKQYSKNGSSCHQCRQKTLDTKTFCRSKECFGVRGQFCGVCLENRYGENAASALKDPNWRCPVCRGICNCSFCRSKAGKRPTGILAPVAHRTGHKSVKDFLDSLRGEGDYADETKNPNNLLGFSKDLNYALMGGGVKHFLFK